VKNKLKKSVSKIAVGPIRRGYVCFFVLYAVFINSVCAATSKTSDIVGNWRVETIYGEPVEDEVREFFFFENGKVLFIWNRIEENGIQISNNFAMVIGLWEYRHKGEIITVIIDGNEDKAIYRNNRVITLSADKREVAYKKVSKNTNIAGIWTFYWDEHIYYTFDIKNDLTGEISEVEEFSDGTTTKIKITLEKITMFDMEFDGKYDKEGGGSNYFILDDDRIIIIEKYGEYISPIILQRQ
jgi:hypothetical protein